MRPVHSIIILLATSVQAQTMSHESMQMLEIQGGSGSNVATQVGELPVSRFKRQAIQKITADGGWLRATKDDLSSSFFETSISLGVPLGSFDHILGVTPSFRIDLVDATAAIEIPTELFEAGVNFFYRTPISDRLSAMAIVRPSVRSDFTTSDDAFRIFGLGLLNWDCKPNVLSLCLGAVYLDRADLPLLPAVGVTWTPDSATKLDLRFPESRIAWRLAKDNGQSELWGYLTVGIGGNTWAVTRTSGQTDELSLRDIRLMFGVDQVTDGGGGWFAEFGFAFNRSIEYESTQSEISLSDGALLQAGWRY